MTNFCSSSSMQTTLPLNQLYPPSQNNLRPSVDKKLVLTARHGSSGRDAPPPLTPGANEAKAPTGRRGHLKSRLGCFNCKRRRVKCNEKRPCCEHCRRLDLVCTYPTSANTSPTTPTAATSIGNVRKNPTCLALEELRFYHQFLTRSFPTLPFHGEELWMKCTAMSHEVRNLQLQPCNASALLFLV